MFAGVLATEGGSSRSVQLTYLGSEKDFAVYELEVGAQKWKLGSSPLGAFLRCGKVHLQYLKKEDSTVSMFAGIFTNEESTQYVQQFAFNFPVQANSDGSARLTYDVKSFNAGYRFLPLAVQVDGAGEVLGSVFADETTRLEGVMTGSNAKVGVPDLGLILFSSVFCHGPVPPDSFGLPQGTLLFANQADEDVKVSLTLQEWPYTVTPTVRDASQSLSAVPTGTYRLSAVGTLTGQVLADTTITVAKGSLEIPLKALPPYAGDPRYAEIRLVNGTLNAVDVLLDNAAGTPAADPLFSGRLDAGQTASYFARPGQRWFLVRNPSTLVVLKELDQVMERGTLFELTLP